MPLKDVRRLADASRQGGEPATVAGTGDGIDMGPLPGLIGYVLRRAQVALFQDFIESFTRHDIRPAQFSVLVVIERNPGLNQSRLAHVLGIKRANLVGMLDVLEARGLAERRQRDDDRRAHGLHLTPKGAALLKELYALEQAHEQRMTARVGKRGKAQLLLLLRQLAAMDLPEAKGAENDE